MQSEQPNILSVSQLTRRVKNILEIEVNRVWVSGEISNWRVSPAGHAYFTLKDKNSQLSAVMFRGKIGRLKFGPEDGIEVILNGMVTVYEARGNYQIICDTMQPKGLGALQLAFEKLRRKLDAEGLFDKAHKKPLPLLPRTIGIVTSPTGAAIRDMLNVIGRRFANVHVLLFPARVQGDEAAPEIVEGIRVLDARGADVIIIGRGGGSLEDLWPFNEEIVVRAVHAAKTPVISAVGHEVDFALTDYAADLRAPTPSAAAELVVQEQEALVAQVEQMRRRLGKAMSYRVEAARHRVTAAKTSYVFQRPEEMIRQRRQQADEWRMRLESNMTEQVRTARNRLEHGRRALALLSPANQMRRAAERLTHLRERLARAISATTERCRGRLRPALAQLDALSPLAIMSRGYALAWKMPEHTLVQNASQLEEHDKVQLRFGQGAATAIIEATDTSDTTPTEDMTDGG